MQIDLPQDIFARVQQLAASTGGASEVEIIRKALDSLDRQASACAAIQEGIDAWQSGKYQELDDFDRRFREQNGIPTDSE